MPRRKWGSVAQKGDRWYAVYTVTDGATGEARRVWDGPHGDEAAAERALVLARSDLEGRVWIDPVLAGVTTGDWLDTWLRRHRANIRPATIRFYAQAIRLYLKPHLGAMPLRDVTAVHVEDMYRELRRRYQADTVAAARTTLRRALKDAVKYGVVGQNVAVNATMPRVDSRGMAAPKEQLQVWNRKQLAAFLDYVRLQQWGLPFEVAAATGMRREEVAGMTWEKVDFDASTITVWWTITQVGGKPVVDGPKTAQSIRSVSIPRALVERLADHRKLQRKLREGCGDDWYHDAEGRDWVWRYPTVGSRGHLPPGRPVLPDFLTKTFAKYLKALPELPPITLYNLRHTHATILLDAGMAEGKISKRLGHSQFTLMNKYIRANADHDRAAAELVDDLF